MKTKLHPTYHNKVTITCSCGASFATGSTEKSLTVEVCSQCHPFYTGKQKFVDVAGRVDKFKQRLVDSKTKKAATKKKTKHTKKTSASSHSKTKDDKSVKIN